MKTKISIEERFWSKVAKTQGTCHIWTAGKDKGGYGVFHPERHPVRAHRFAWQITKGPIPENHFVCHSCDTPACCNPEHLFIGTHDDNVADKVAKGRQSRGAQHSARVLTIHRPRGENHKSAKLTEAQVSEIRRRYIPRQVSMRSLAHEFQVSEPLIGRIIRGEIWQRIH